MKELTVYSTPSNINPGNDTTNLFCNLNSLAPTTPPNGLEKPVVPVNSTLLGGGNFLEGIVTLEVIFPSVTESVTGPSAVVITLYEPGPA